MKERIRELRLSYKKLFGDDVYNKSHIEITDGNEIVLSANREGLLLLVEEILVLCEKDQIGAHYHLDEAGMANKCEKPFIIQLQSEQ